MDIEQQLHTEIAIINRTLAAFGVDAGTMPRWTTIAGTSFVTFGLRTGATQRIAEVQRLLPELSERLSAARRRPTPVRLREMPLALEAPHPAPAPLDWRGAVLRVGAGRLVCGRNYSATPAADLVLDLDSRPHVLVCGTTGSGKSTLLRMALCSLAYSSDPAGLRLVLVDRKHEDLEPFARLPHVDAAAYTAADAQRAIGAVHGELQRRVNAGRGEWPRLVLAIDELAQVDAQGLALLEDILALGRSKRIHCIAATQHPTTRLIGSKANYPARLVGAVVDANTAAIATGRAASGAELLPGCGAFLYVDGARLERLQAYHLTHEAAVNLVGVIADKWGGASTPLLPMTVEPMTPVEDEVERIARTIEPLWRQGASKNAMCKAALDRPYAGSYAGKIDRALALLDGSTTTAPTRQFAVVWQAEDAQIAGSSREPAPILRMGGAR